MTRDTNLQKAHSSWPEIPDWVEVLANECDRSSQSEVAKQIGYSGSAISQAISNKYGNTNGGRIDLMEKAVRGAFMGGVVKCPVLGTLEINRCLTHQRAKFSATNPTRVRLKKACQTCPNRKS